MINKIKNSKAIDIFELVFKIVFLVHVVLAFNALYNITGWLKVTSALSLGLGGIVVLLRLVCVKEYIKRKDVWIIVAFFASYVLSMLVNRQYGLTANVKCLVWMGICFAALYLIKPGKRMESLKFDFTILGNIYIVMMTVQGVICNYMFFTQYNRRIITDNANKAIGFYLNRLMGLYDDTNQGAVSSAMCIIIALYLIPRVKNIFARIWYIFSIVVMGMFIVLSVSRTALIGVVVGVFVYIFFATLVKNNGGGFKKASIYAILCAAAIVACYGPVKKQLANISNKILELKQEKEAEKNDAIDDAVEDELEEIIEEEPILIVEEIQYVSLERDDVNLDISNHRFDIWKWGVKHFIKKPLLGYGRYSFVPRVMATEPNCYEESNGTAHIDACHNMVIDVMVAQGSVGLVIFLVWMGVCLYTLIKYFRFIDKEHRGFAALMFALLMLNLVSSLIMPAVLYINSATAFMAWLTLGILMHMMKEAKINYEKASDEERKWKNPFEKINKYATTGEFIYLVALAMYLTATIASLTAPMFNTEGIWGTIRKLNSLLRYASYGVFIIKMLYDCLQCNQNREYISKILRVLCCMGCIGMALMGYIDKSLVFFGIILLAADGCSSRKVVMTSTIVQSVLLLLVIGLSQISVIKDYVRTDLDGIRTRHYLGFGYATYAPMLFVFIVFGFIYVKKGKLNLFEQMVILSIAYWLYKMSDARSSFFIIVVAVCIFELYNRLRISGKIKKILDLFSLFLPLFSFLTALIMHACYNEKNMFIKKINIFLSGRLELGKLMIEKNGINFFGSNIKFYGYDLSVDAYVENYNYVDSDFIRILLSYGIITTVIVILLYTLIIYCSMKLNKRFVSIIVFMILILGVVEPRLINITFNPFAILSVTMIKEMRLNKICSGEKNG